MEVTVTVTESATPTTEPVVMVPDPDYVGWSDDDVSALAARVAAEECRRLTLAEAAGQVERAAATWRAAQGLTDGTAWAPPTGAHDAVPPGEARVFEGDLWRNTSGTYLAHSPADFPAGWTLESEDTPPVIPDPADHPAWAAGTAYVVGDVVSHAGAVYRATQGHTAQVGWEPPVVPALWAVI